MADIEQLVINLYRAGEIGYADPQPGQHPHTGYKSTRKGTLSPHYVNGRGMTGFSRELPLTIDEQLHTREMAAEAIAELLARQGLDWDHLYGLPQAGTPLAVLVASVMRRSVLWGRVGVKDHGAQSPVEGNHAKRDTLALVDNVITAGGSAETEADKLELAGFSIVTLAVLVDREEGGPENLARRESPIPVASVTTMTEVTSILHGAGMINDRQVALAEAYRDSPPKLYG